MADNPQGSGASQEFGKYFARFGIEFDKEQMSNLGKQLTPIEAMLKNLGKSASFKDSWFSKLPGITKDTDNANKSHLTFVKTLLAAGTASKHGADGGKFYSESLGFMGKGLVNLIDLLPMASKGVDGFGLAAEGALTAATLGFAALIAIVMKVIKILGSVAVGMMEVQDTLNEYNKLLGGQTIENQQKFNKQLTDTILAVNKYGFSMETILQTSTAYIKNGLAPQVALNERLMGVTGMLSKVTGESTDSIASMFSGLILGSRVSITSLEKMSDQFTAFNKSVSAAGMGAISMGRLKEAIDSSGTAFLIASSKGEKFVSTLTRDLMGLSGLTQSLGISVSELGSKFEEASNLMLSQESGFRALLAISGGANFSDMLTNQFNRTEATLKIITQLKSLNDSLGGNLSIMGQVAQQAFGVNKDTAIKLAQTSKEQIDSLRRVQEFSDKVVNTSLKQSYDSVRGTLSEAWEKLKAVFQGFIYRILANDQFQAVLSRISQMISKFAESLGDPNSALGRLSITIEKFMGTTAQWIENNIVPYIEKFSAWINELVTGKSIWEVLKTALGDIATEMGKLFAKGAALMLHAVLPWWFFSAEGDTTIAAWKSEQEAKDAEDTARNLRAEGTNKILNIASKDLERIQKQIDDARRERDRYAGISDTEAVINRKGELTLAGLERNELDTAIESEQKKLTAATEESAKQSKRVADAIEFLLKEGKPGESTNALLRQLGVNPPKAPKSVVSGAQFTPQEAAAYTGGRSR